MAIRELGYAVEKDGTLVREGKEKPTRTREEAEALRTRGGGELVRVILADQVTEPDPEVQPIPRGLPPDLPAGARQRPGLVVTNRDGNPVRKSSGDIEREERDARALLKYLKRRERARDGSVPQAISRAFVVTETPGRVR